jgi:hypothetical protein
LVGDALRAVVEKSSKKNILLSDADFFDASEASVTTTTSLNVGERSGL